MGGIIMANIELFFGIKLKYCLPFLELDKDIEM